MGLSINYINNHASEIILAGWGEGRGVMVVGHPQFFMNVYFAL